MAKKEKASHPKILSMRELSFYLSGAVGSGMVFSIMSSLITDFYMNVMRLNWVFVFLLMLLARIWDSFTDPMMGVIMDRMNPKRGKMRSWLMYAPGIIMVFTFAMFFIPGGAEQEAGTMLMVYAAITYVIWGLAFTVVDIPFWSLPLAMTPHEKERGQTISLGRMTNGIGAAVPMALFMILTPVLARTMEGASELVRNERMYMIIALICAIGGGILLFATPFNVKERVPLPKAENKGALKNVLTCKPLMLTALMGILAGGRYMLQAGAAHVARFAFYPNIDPNNLPAGQTLEIAVADSIASVAFALQIATAAGMLAAMIAVPILLGRFNYKQMLIGSCLVGGVAGLVLYFMHPGFMVAAAMLLLVAIPVGVINSVGFAMVGDALDFMEWQKGLRYNGLGLACQSFVLKLGNALATAAIVLVYPLVDLNPGESAGDVNLTTIDPAKRPGVQRGFFSIISIIPAISLLIAIIPMLFYDLTGEKKETVMRELSERRAAEEEAAQALAEWNRQNP